MFGRFLQEFYDHDDLLFFLYVRSVLAKVLHISFKARWAKKFDGVSGQPKALWISFKEAAHVARIVFGSDNEGLFRDFMRLITPQMVGEKTASGDTRRIDITEYLHLSVVGYHQSQQNQNPSQGTFFGNFRYPGLAWSTNLSCFTLLHHYFSLYAEGRMLVPIPGQLAPDVQAPSPTGLSYNYTNTRTQSGSPVSELHNGGGAGGAQGEAGDDEYYSFDYPPVSVRLFILGCWLHVGPLVLWI